VKESISIGVTGILTFSGVLCCLVGAQPLLSFIRVIQEERAWAC
jgi:hypothetical protein